MLSIIGIILGLIILIVLAYKGWNVVIVSLIASLVVVIFSKMNLYDATYNAYMNGFQGWAGKFFLMIASGSIFAKIMDLTGGAQTISHYILKAFGKKRLFWLLFGLCFVTSLLNYGGINCWVIVFVMVPIMYPIFKELDLSWEIALAVFVMGANGAPNYLPGAATIFNVMPTKYLGTTSTAGWKLALFFGPFYYIAGFLYIYHVIHKKEKMGEGFVKPANLKVTELRPAEELPKFWKAITPIIAVLVILNLFDIDVFFALMLGSLTGILLMKNHIKNIVQTVGDGVVNSMAPVINTCAVVGFGSVVAATPGFETITQAIINGVPGSPYVSWALSVTSLAGVTGSASGGLAIALETLLPKFKALNLNPNILHRISSVACGGLDTLPHNGAIITELSIFGIDHKHGYKYFFILSLVISLLQLIPAFLAIKVFY